eukprot:TRINITY_DN10266_c1_g2_i3.p1 TRINITY_DN10266_c1_g2~~TRINITY_DN10266_c1_g2_i3.p1  ORF type:complete len:363 (+),score=6.62 TRINITY_DN10266_c1_g2_i3:183-1271(+)
MFHLSLKPSACQFKHFQSKVFKSKTLRRERKIYETSCGLCLPPVYKYCEPWGVWTGLFAAAAIGLWSERTIIGRELSGSMVCTLVGLIASNIGLMPSSAPQLDVVQKQILTLVIPLLLFQANIRQVLKGTGKLLFPFLLGSVFTIMATFIAISLFPLQQLGSDGWKVASALCSRHIGGAVNYVSVSQALEVGQSAQTAGLAADNLACPLYFISLYALSKSIPVESGDKLSQDQHSSNMQQKNQIKMEQGCLSICISMFICAIGCTIVNYYNIKQWLLPTITLLAVFAASIFPTQMQSLAPAAAWIAGIGIQVYRIGVFCSNRCEWKNKRSNKHCSFIIRILFNSNFCALGTDALNRRKITKN